MKGYTKPAIVAVNKVEVLLTYGGRKGGRGRRPGRGHS